MTSTNKKGVQQNITFHEQPYDQNEKFSVYIPKPQDKISDLIARENAKTPASRYGYNHFEKQQQEQGNQREQQNSRQSFKEKLINQVEFARDDNQQQQQQQQQQSQQEYDLQQQQQQSLQHSQTLKNLRQNQFVQTSQSRGTGILRNTTGSNKNTTGYGKFSIMQRSQERLRQKLYFDEKTRTIPKTTLKNKIIEDIVEDSQVFLKNKQLMESVLKLKQLNLLRANDVHLNRFSGVGKFNFVYNDFHTKSTNPGYSRNDKGGFYTR